VPLGKVVVKAIEPSELAQVVGFVPIPAVKVGDAGSVKILVVAALLVHPAFVMENPENVPSGNPVKENAPLVMVTLCGFPAPV
jgi:hypothetical protein